MALLVLRSVYNIFAAGKFVVMGMQKEAIANYNIGRDYAKAGAAARWLKA